MARSFRRGRALASLWFPAALTVLLLLALPSAVFLMLHLFGKESALNGWLKDRFWRPPYSAWPRLSCLSKRRPQRVERRGFNPCSVSAKLEGGILEDNSEANKEG